MKRENDVPEGLLGKLAAWACALAPEQIPARVVEKAKLQALSVLAAVHAASRTRQGKAVAGAARALYGGGGSRIVPTGEEASAAAAVFAAAAMSVAQDYDDYLFLGHTGHSAVCVPLLLGAQLGAAPREVLAAQVVANEIEGRLGAAALFGPHNGQTWSHVHLAGSAAAAARLMGLAAGQAAHAMAAALALPPYVLPPGFMGPDSKLLAAAAPALLGLQAAHLAARGLTGAPDVLEARGGFFDRFTWYPLPQLLSGLGSAWVTDTLAFKVYPGCAYVDTAIDALLEIAERRRAEAGRALDPGEVEEIAVETTLLGAAVDRMSAAAAGDGPPSAVGLGFSIRWSVALALLAGKLEGDDATEEALARREGELAPLAGRVKVTHSPALTLDLVRTMKGCPALAGLFGELDTVRVARALAKMHAAHGDAMDLAPVRDALLGNAGRILEKAARGAAGRIGGWIREGSRREPPWSLDGADLEPLVMPFASRVTVRTKDGAALAARRDVPRGAPGRPPEETRALVERKFLVETAPLLGGERAKEARGALLRFEEQPSTRAVLDLVCTTR